MTAKIISLTDWQPRNCKVVLAHGCFDLLHLGHAKYLEAAKRLGDFLLVSLTDDKFVNKGPNRPVFPVGLRAEMVAALECVDAVTINHAPTAIPVIEIVRPALYVKGSDYRNGGGEIDSEVAAVRRCGGEVHFTDEITFSSSALINRHLAIARPETRSYLERARQLNFMEAVPALLERLKNMRVLIVGETIIDEYVYTSPLGKPPKESVLAVLSESREEFEGGVLAAANHLRSFVGEVDILTNSEPSICKTRIIEKSFGKKLFEIYSSTSCSPCEATDVMERAKSADVVIVFDFGHGFLTPYLRRALRKHAKFLAVNAQSNSANHGFNLITQYESPDYACIDAPEARLAVRMQNASIQDIAEKYLHEWMKPKRLAITHGSEGCVVRDKNGVVTIPPFSSTVVDTMGAGDAFLAITAPLAKIADSMEIVGFVGNAVGAMKVATVGHRQPIEKTALLGYISSLLK